jgi:hypothetical protein
MKSRFGIRKSNAKMVFALYILLIVHSCARAQGLQRISERGYEVSIGLHNFVSKGGQCKISNLAPSSRGVAWGYFFGNNLFKMRLKGIGYYGSTEAVNTKFNQYEAEALINVYPLEFVRTSKNILDMYLVMGFNFTHVSVSKYESAISHPYGQLNHVAGIGFEYLMRRGSKVMRLFSEMNFGNRFYSSAKTEKQLSPLPHIVSAVNFGVRIGYKKALRAKPSGW